MRFGPSPTASVYRTLNFGPSDTDYRSIGHQSIGPSDTEPSVHQTPSLKNLQHNYWLLPTYPHPVTRARDLNKNLTLLTSKPSRRLKRGLRPLGASNPPNPPYPPKGAPSGRTPKSNHYRAAALRPAGK